ncbi:hypothetical protein D3C84_852990 [compost metagenome]
MVRLGRQRVEVTLVKAATREEAFLHRFLPADIEHGARGVKGGEMPAGVLLGQVDQFRTSAHTDTEYPGIFR